MLSVLSTISQWIFMMFSLWTDVKDAQFSAGAGDKSPAVNMLASSKLWSSYSDENV